MRFFVLGLRRAWTGRPGIRAASALAILAGAVVLAGPSGLASADNGPPGVAIPYGSSYEALIDPQDAPTAGWYTDLHFDETGWAADQAPFGYGTACAQNSNQTTGFPLGSTIYLRKSFTLPANAYGLHVVGTIDNYADVYVNGKNYQGRVASGNCATDAIDFPVPSSDLLPGGNLVAVQAQDDGSTASYFDMQASYGALQFTVEPAETLKLSTISPVTVTLTDARGQPVSGKDVTVSLVALHGNGSLSGTTTETTDNGGQATFSDLSVDVPGQYKLEARVDGTTVATSDPFAVDNLEFGQQPTETQKGSPISPAPTVTIKDPYGNGIPGKTVTLQLQTITGNGTLSGTLTATTDGSGLATFSNLVVSASGQYQLDAKSDIASTTSNAFLIDDQITPCTGSCSAGGSTSNTSVSASSASTGGSLAVSVVGNAGAPSGVCGGNFTQVGAGAYVNLLGGNNGNLQLSWTVDRSLVGRRLALSFNVCLGADNLQDLQGTHTTGWKTMDGSPATPVADSNLGVTLFWGQLRQCLLVPWSHGLPTSPCWNLKYKNLRGDVVITAFVPYPWDGSWHVG